MSFVAAGWLPYMIYPTSGPGRQQMDYNKLQHSSTIVPDNGVQDEVTHQF